MKSEENVERPLLDYTIAQWLEHRWLQARVPGSSPGGDSQFFLQTFPVCLFPSNQLKGKLIRQKLKFHQL